MIPSAAITLIKKQEIFSRKAYWDVNGWAIGYGSHHWPNGDRVFEGETCTEDQADKMLMAYLDKECTPALSRIPSWSQMNDNQKASLYDFSYNLGAGFYGSKGFESITNLCNRLDEWSRNALVLSVFALYDHAGGKINADLLKRRKAEAALFCKAVG